MSASSISRGSASASSAATSMVGTPNSRACAHRDRVGFGEAVAQQVPHQRLGIPTRGVESLACPMLGEHAIVDQASGQSGQGWLGGCHDFGTAWASVGIGGACVGGTAPMICVRYSTSEGSRRPSSSPPGLERMVPVSFLREIPLALLSSAGTPTRAFVRGTPRALFLRGTPSHSRGLKASFYARGSPSRSPAEGSALGDHATTVSVAHAPSRRLWHGSGGDVVRKRWRLSALRNGRAV